MAERDSRDDHGTAADGSVAGRGAPWPTLSEIGANQVTAGLRRMIEDGTLAFGDRLPAERDIAKTFGCSRNTARKALVRLVEIGYVKRRVGSGTYVTFAPAQDALAVAERISPRELTDYRLAIEPYAVRLAVQNASVSDVARLRRLLDELHAAGRDNEPEVFSQLDKRFHELIMELTRNQLFVHFYKDIGLIRERQEWQAVKDRLLTPAKIREYNAGHDEIMAAFGARDGEAAERAMRAHLSLIRDDVGS